MEKHCNKKERGGGEGGGVSESGNVNAATAGAAEGACRETHSVLSLEEA